MWASKLWVNKNIWAKGYQNVYVFNLNMSPSKSQVSTWHVFQTCRVISFFDCYCAQVLCATPQLIPNRIIHPGSPLSGGPTFHDRVATRPPGAEKTPIEGEILWKIHVPSPSHGPIFFHIFPEVDFSRGYGKPLVNLKRISTKHLHFGVRLVQNQFPPQTRTFNAGCVSLSSPYLTKTSGSTLW